MRGKTFDSANKIETPASGTTSYIKYNRKQRILEVEYRGSKVYQYLSVPEAVWEEYRNVILSRGSSGGFVNREIKPNYRYVEI